MGAGMNATQAKVTDSVRMPLFNESCDRMDCNDFTISFGNDVTKAFRRFKKEHDSQLVVLLRILAHECNHGYRVHRCDKRAGPDGTGRHTRVIARPLAHTWMRRTAHVRAARPRWVCHCRCLCCFDACYVGAVRYGPPGLRARGCRGVWSSCTVLAAAVYSTRSTSRRCKTCGCATPH